MQSVQARKGRQLPAADDCGDRRPPFDGPSFRPAEEAYGWPALAPDLDASASRKSALRDLEDGPSSYRPIPYEQESSRRPVCNESDQPFAHVHDDVFVLQSGLNRLAEAACRRTAALDMGRPGANTAVTDFNIVADRAAAAAAAAGCECSSPSRRGAASHSNINAEVSAGYWKSAAVQSSLKRRRGRLAQQAKQKWVSMDSGEALQHNLDLAESNSSPVSTQAATLGLSLAGFLQPSSRKTSTVSEKLITAPIAEKSEASTPLSPNAPSSIDPMIANNSKARTIIAQTRRRDTVRLKGSDNTHSPPTKRHVVACATPPQLVVTDSAEIELTPTATDVAKPETPKTPDLRLPSINNNWKDQVIAFFQPSDNKLAMKLFGTKSALLKEKRRQQQTGHWIIHPCSNFRFYWDFWMLLLLIANMIILPVAISFFQEDDDGPDAMGHFELTWIFMFNIVSDVIFVLDIAINFRTGVILNDFADEILLDPGQIAYHYLRTWFVVDIISSIPFDYIYKAIDSSSSAGFNYHLMHAGRALRILRLAKLLSLLRLLRFSRLVRYVTQWEEFLNIATMVMRVFNLVLLILLLGHWNACLQFLVPMLRDFPADSWVAIQELKDRPWMEQYTWAIFKALSHMLCIGYGQFPPQSLSDAWLTMVSMMTGAISYAMFVGHATALIQSFDTSRRLYREKFKQVEEYMAYRKLPRALRQRISSYYEHRYQGKMFDENEILRELSECLREQIINYNCRALVAAVPFLTYADQNFVSEIVTKLVFEVYQPGDLIVKESTMGDRMFFIQEGIVDVIGSSGELITSLTEGSYFGEICLLGNTKRVASVRAETYCNLYSLSREHFLSVLEQYPVMRRTIESIAAERLMQIGLDPSIISKRADLQEDLHTVKEIVQRVAGEQTEDTDESDESICQYTSQSQQKRYHKKKKKKHRQRPFLKIKTHLSVKANLQRTASDAGSRTSRNLSCSDPDPDAPRDSQKSKWRQAAHANTQSHEEHVSSEDQETDLDTRNAKQGQKRGFRLSAAFLPNFSKSSLSVRDAFINTFKPGVSPTHSRQDTSGSPYRGDYLGLGYNHGSDAEQSLRPDINHQMLNKKHSLGVQSTDNAPPIVRKTSLRENSPKRNVERTHSDTRTAEVPLLNAPPVDQTSSNSWLSP